MTQKTALLLHGFRSTHDSFFLPTTKQHLENNGFMVLSPSFPRSQNPQFDAWAAHLQPQLKVLQNQVDLIVAHSLGGCLALQLLSQQRLQAAKVFLIGSSFGPKDTDSMNSFLVPFFNLSNIKKNAKKIYSVFSYDDPWTLAEYGSLLIKQLNAVGIVYSDQGHFEQDYLPEEVLCMM